MGKAVPAVIGYTCGTFDLFHQGHVNILRAAKSMCDILIVGVSADEIVSYKKKECIIPIEQRIEIIRNIKWVDVAIPQRDLDKVKAHDQLKFDILFVGDDWYDSESWNRYEVELSRRGVNVVYFPYTKTTSTTKIIERVLDLHGSE
jgi:glycerol-3-phosphate cytidylyltransferase